jgi:hypothetical protein
MKYKEAIEKYHDDIVKRFESSRVLENILTEHQINQLMLYQFQNSERVRWTASSNNIQPACNTEKIFKNLPWMQELFENEMEPFSETHSGNFFITTQLHDIHADLLTEKETESHSSQENLVPYKSCVIPLAIGYSSVAHTAFFDQRHIGHSITLDRDYQSSQKNSLYKISREYPDFYLLTGEVDKNKKKYSSQDQEYIFPHVNDRNLDGLTIESVYEFKPGNIMLFDACQLHASCVHRSRPNFHGLKNGINIQFYREI